MTEPEKDPIDELVDEFKEFGKGVARELSDSARDVAKELEETYDDLDKEYDLKDRWTGAAIGGKLGLILGGPFVLKTALGGAVAGFIKGKDGVDMYRKWRDERDDVSNDDDSPKSPNDGP